MLDDFSTLEKQLELHELALLKERKLKFHSNGKNVGQFTLDANEFRRIDEKIYFLVSKFGTGVESSGLEKGDRIWQSFEDFRKARNSVVHPRDTESDITVVQVEAFIATAKDVIRILGKQIWNKTIKF